MEALRFVRVAVWILGLLLGSSATLRSQTNTLLVGSTVLSFTHQIGGSPPATQGVLVLSTGTSLAFTAGATTVTGGTWLSVGPVGASTPATLTVSVNPTGLVAADYTGAITITSAGAVNSPVTVAVTLTVRSVSPLVVSPSALSFHFQSVTGGIAPASQTLAIASSGSALGYTVAPATTTGGGWLLVNPPSGLTPGGVEVSVNVAGLLPATYNGSITVTAAGASNSPVNVPVTLTVSASPKLLVSPAPLTFFFQTGGALPGAQAIAVASSGTATPFVVTSTTTSGGSSWLVPSPLSGVTPASVSVAVVPAGLGVGTYSGSITITASGAAGSPQTIPITLVVTTSPLLYLGPGSLTFSYQAGGSLPALQSLGLTSSGGALSYAATATASGGAWLAIGPVSGTTAGSMTVAVSPTGLTPGTYTGAITITAAGAGNSPVVVPVRLVVSFSPLLEANPAALAFAFQTGQAGPASQSITVTSTGAPVSMAIAAGTASGGSWLSTSVATATTPAAFTVLVAPAGLSAGTYTGSITLTADGAGNSPLTIGVTLVVSSTALLVVSPGALVFDVTAGSGGSAVRNVALTSTDGTVLSFTVTSSTSSGGSWLLVGPLSGSTPSNLSVSANATGLGAGTYAGSITVAAGASANSPQTIAVTLRVAPAATMAASPATLSFTQTSGGAAPAPASVALTSSGGAVSFTVSATTTSGGTWLSVTPSGGTTPANLSILANGAGLPPGTYDGTITVVSAGATNTPLNIRVSLVVGAALSSSASNLTFNFQIGGAMPAAQAVSLSTTATTALTFTATAAAASGTWLSVSPTAGTTPSTVSVAVNPAGLAAATYDGTVTIAATGAVNSPLVINVRLVVAAAPVLPFISAIVNGASFQPTSVSPGQIVSLFGTTIGPATAALLRVTSGVFDITIGETRVLFDGIASPMIYASNRQVSAIVPYNLAGRLNTQLQVEFQGVRSNTIQLRVVDAAPGIFTIDSSGTGQGAILNANFSVNSPANPTARGSVVMIYATGEGQTNPGGSDGLVTGSVLRRPLQNVTVTIGGVAAEVLYAGSAPGLVSGLLQVNARVADAVVAGNSVPVVVTIGGVASQAGVTMAVR